MEAIYICRVNYLGCFMCVEQGHKTTLAMAPKPPESASTKSPLKQIATNPTRLRKNHLGRCLENSSIYNQETDKADKYQ